MVKADHLAGAAVRRYLFPEPFVFDKQGYPHWERSTLPDVNSVYLGGLGVPHTLVCMYAPPGVADINSDVGATRGPVGFAMKPKRRSRVQSRTGYSDALRLTCRISCQLR